MKRTIGGALTQLKVGLRAGLHVVAGRLAVRPLLRSEDGATAVEFGLIALPFLALLFAILETAFVFFAQQVLENGAAVAGRLVMTGQAQSNQVSTGQPMTAGGFQTAACAAMSGFFNCSTNLIVDVQTYSSFGTANSSSATSAPLNATNNTLTLNTQNPNFNMGGPGDIVVVRLMYQWPVWVSLPGLTSMMDLASSAGQSMSGRLLMATSVFRNEPYQSGS
jgi:Flp pilus assembly protein TadG